MHKLYKKNDLSNTAFIITGGKISVSFGSGDKFEFPGDNIIIGTVEHFLEQSLKESVPRIFDLSISNLENCKQIPFETVDQMMMQYKFGTNSNIFLSRLIEFYTAKLIEKSKTPLGFLRKYQRRAGAYAKTVDLLFDIGIRTNNKLILDLAKQKKTSEIYKDGSVNIHYTPIEAISSPARDKSNFIKQFKQNTLLCHEGSTGRELFILLDGSINVTYKNQLVANISTPGEAFGEMSLFLDHKRTASLVADKDSHVYVVPYTQLSDFSKQKCPDLFIKLAQGLSKRLAETLQRVARLEHLINKAESRKDQGPAQSDLDDTIDHHMNILSKEMSKLSEIVEPKVAKLLAPILIDLRK